MTLILSLVQMYLQMYVKDFGFYTLLLTGFGFALQGLRGFALAMKMLLVFCKERGFGFAFSSVQYTQMIICFFFCSKDAGDDVTSITPDTSFFTWMAFLKWHWNVLDILFGNSQLLILCLFVHLCMIEPTKTPKGESSSDRGGQSYRCWHVLLYVQ